MKGIDDRLPPVIDAGDFEIGDVLESDGWWVRSAHARHVQPFLDSLVYRIESHVGDVMG